MVRVWGPGALAVADAAFRPARGASLAETPRERLRFGRIGAGLGDEVVAVVIAGDPPEVEIHCHGGPAAVALVVEALVGQGAERRQPGAWVRHAAQSTIEAEALVDLARSPTQRTAEILLEQAEGALAGAVRRLIAALAEDPAAALHGPGDPPAARGDRGPDGYRLAGGAGGPAQRRQEPAAQRPGGIRPRDRRRDSRHDPRRRHRSDRPRWLAGRAGRYRRPPRPGGRDRGRGDRPGPGPSARSRPPRRRPRPLRTLDRGRPGAGRGRRAPPERRP